MSNEEQNLSTTSFSQNSDSIPDSTPSVKMKKSDYIGRFPQLWECLAFEMRQKPDKVWTVDELFKIAKQKYEGQVYTTAGGWTKLEQIEKNTIIRSLAKAKNSKFVRVEGGYMLSNDLANFYTKKQRTALNVKLKRMRKPALEIPEERPKKKKKKAPKFSPPPKSPEPSSPEPPSPEESPPKSIDESSNDVVKWLNEIGLEQYADNFIKQGYDDLSVLIDDGLDENDIKAIGITLQGHIKKLKVKLKQLQNKS